MSDLEICAWVLVVVAQMQQAWERGYAGQVSEWAGKISGYYVGEQARMMIQWWTSKGLEAAKQEAQC